MNERTSYVVSAKFQIVGRDGTGVSSDHPLAKRLLVGHFHDEHQAQAHVLRVREALEQVPWITDVHVARETVWHLRSGRAAAQLVSNIFGHSPWIEPSRQEAHVG